MSGFDKPPVPLTGNGPWTEEEIAAAIPGHPPGFFRDDRTLADCVSRVPTAAYQPPLRTFAYQPAFNVRSDGVDFVAVQGYRRSDDIAHRVGYLPGQTIAGGSPNPPAKALERVPTAQLVSPSALAWALARLDAESDLEKYGFAVSDAEMDEFASRNAHLYDEKADLLLSRMDRAGILGK